MVATSSIGGGEKATRRHRTNEPGPHQCQRAGPLGRGGGEGGQGERQVEGAARGAATAQGEARRHLRQEEEGEGGRRGRGEPTHQESLRGLLVRAPAHPPVGRRRVGGARGGGARRDGCAGGEQGGGRVAA